MFDTVECPYCEHENDMSDGLTDLPNDNKFDHECENCEREFEVEVEFDPVYSGFEIEYVDCEKCGQETRDPVKKGKTFPWPKSINAKVICRDCFYKALRDEYQSEGA